MIRRDVLEEFFGQAANFDAGLMALLHSLGWSALLLWIGLALLLALAVREGRLLLAGSPPRPYEEFLPLRGRWLGRVLLGFAWLVLVPLVGVPAGAILFGNFLSNHFYYAPKGIWYSEDVYARVFGVVLGMGLTFSAALYRPGGHHTRAGILLLGSGITTLLVFAGLVALITWGWRTPQFSTVFWHVLEKPGSSWPLKCAVLLCCIGAGMLLFSGRRGKQSR